MLLRPVASLAAFALSGVAVLLSARASRADDGPTTKAYSDKNFSMTIPKDWTIEDVEAGNADAGYVCVARRSVTASMIASAWALVRDAAGSNLDDLMAQVRDNKVRDLEQVTADDPVSVDWAGAQGAKYLRVVGKAKNGSKSLFRVFGAIVHSKFHQLDIRAFNGVEEKIGGELDAVAAGYKFLAGAKAGPGGGEGGTPPEGAPAGANSVRFDKLGCTWTLPKAPEEPDKPRWAFASGEGGNPHLDGTSDGTLAAAGFSAGEGGAAEISVHVHPGKPGLTAKAAIGNDDNFSHLVDAFEGTPVPNLDEDVKIGNWHGAARSFAGKSKTSGKPLFIRVVLATLRAALYEVRLTAEDKAEQKYKAEIQAALSGIRWDDTGEGVRGPWAAPFPSTTETRKDSADVGRETTIIAAGVRGTKPAAFSRIKWDATNDSFKNYSYAAEARKPGAYMFFSIWRVPAGVFQRSIPPRAPESKIDEHEGEWKNVLQDPETMTQTKGKANKIPDAFKGLKGFRYEFKGIGDGNPFLERGWVIHSGQWIYWIRTQYGGKDGENAFKDEWKDLLGSLKFD